MLLCKEEIALYSKPSSAVVEVVNAREHKSAFIQHRYHFVSKSLPRIKFHKRAFDVNIGETGEQGFASFQDIFFEALHIYFQQGWLFDLSAVEDGIQPPDADRPLFLFFRAREQIALQRSDGQQGG